MLLLDALVVKVVVMPEQYGVADSIGIVRVLVPMMLQERSRVEAGDSGIGSEDKDKKLQVPRLSAVLVEPTTVLCLIRSACILKVDHDVRRTTLYGSEGKWKFIVDMRC